jgi:hypothetical protein
MTPVDSSSYEELQAALRAVLGVVSGRKLRLFAASCFRRISHLLSDDRQRAGVEMMEQMAEGTATAEEWRAAVRAVRLAIPREAGRAVGGGNDLHFVGLMLYRELVAPTLASHAIHLTAGLAGGREETAAQLRLFDEHFRDPFNPFCPAAPAPEWRTPLVASLAEAAYEHRDLPSGHLDLTRLAVLSDALEETGCTDADLLSHLRSPGPHVRGCWALDHVLGKE